MCFRQMLGCSARRLDVQVDRKKLKTDKAYVPNWQSAASAGRGGGVRGGQHRPGGHHPESVAGGAGAGQDQRRL